MNTYCSHYFVLNETRCCVCGISHYVCRQCGVHYDNCGRAT